MKVWLRHMAESFCRHTALGAPRGRVYAQGGSKANMTPLQIPRLLLALRQLRARERWTRPQIEAYQQVALARQRAYAYAHSPFYRDFHKGVFDRPLPELPVLTKATLMEHFDDLVTDRAIRLDDVRAYAAATRPIGLFRDRYRVTATSGSSGRPGYFLFSETEWLTIMASFARGQEWSGATISLLHRRRMATVASISPWHVSSQVAASAQTWWTPSLRLAASDPLESLVERLNAWHPQILITYASMARLLAEEQLAGRLCIQLETVFTSSEVLTEETRRRARAAWGIEPFNQYGATETAEIAAERRGCHRLHLFDDLVLVEPVDEHDRPVPAGTLGVRLLVTTLFSRTQPLIRYALEDSVRLAPEAHACGLTFGALESIQGRVEDTLQLPGTTGARVSVRPLVFNRVMDILPVSGWQVIQGVDDGLTVLLSGVRDANLTATVAGRLRASLNAEGVRPPSISVRAVDRIPQAPSGKAPLIKGHQRQ